MDYKKLEGLKSARDASYDFIQVCFQKGLVTFESAKKAQDSVHKDYLRDIEELEMQPYAEENAYQMVNFN